MAILNSYLSHYQRVNPGFFLEIHMGPKSFFEEFNITHA